LLRAEDLTDALAWAARRKEDWPEITALQRSLLEASEAHATALAVVERKRLEERERLIAREEAQRRTFALLAGLLALVVSEQMIDRSQFVAETVNKTVEDSSLPTAC
jgi:hypothetical protein